MSIRLNKVIKECNVGLQTAVEFLQKKGFSDVEANPSAKITDEQYALLVAEFKTDKGLRKDATILSKQRQNKEKKETITLREPQTVEIKTSATLERRPKVVGHIDLDNLNGEKTAAPAKPAQEETVASVAPAVEETPRQSEPVVAAAAAEPKQPEVKVVPEEPQIVTTPTPTPTDQAIGTEENGVFRLNKTGQTGPQLVVKGRIDLASLNQSTRPKKKSKEERRKEREDKRSQQDPRRQGDAAKTATGEKKKRVRIGKERVDVSSVGTQGGQNSGAQAGKKNNGNNNNNHSANAGGKHNNRKKPQQQPKAEVTEEDVAKQVKETLARLTNKSKAGKGAKYRKEKRDNARANMEEQLEERAAESKVLKLTEFVTANELASMMNVAVTQVIGTCMSIGIMVSINQRLDAETINIVAEEFGFKTEYVSAEVSEAVTEEEDDEEDLVPRAPIVTVMGHVDHGKTSLLDYIRKTNVIAGEAGGITQHIGAYNVRMEDGRHITFLDTPGHEAFTAMRARGAQVTDIAIIIIAADDDIMPQTKEAINHAVAANVPIVFAINKVDKPAANPDKIKEGLAAMNFLVEDWGGKYQSQDISAKKGDGVAELMEKVLLEAEMLDLKANPNRKATGSIIESSLDKGRGYVATVLVSNGTLRIGDIVLAGTNFGRVKAMFNERNQRVKEIGPAQAATILGLNGAPTAGDTFHVMETEQEAREIAGKREQLQREQGLRTQKMLTLDEVGRRIALGGFQELNVIVKGDVDGSIEALSDSLIKLSTEKIAVNVIHKAVGQISESDVALAAASEAIIIGFQVRPSAMARKSAEMQGVDIRLYSIIYDAIEEVKAAMEGMLAPELKEEVTAQLDVRQVYHISKVGTVAGAFVSDGKVHRSDKARLIRDGIVVHTGQINALKRFKDDVKEVGLNFECGISLVNYNDIREGDIIETYQEVEVKAKL
ncbi:MAG: translation initiation factor IF-2 [Clostridium sp.]|nr:translation initiation factor IF-2 [Clostridium sp.]